MTMNDTTLEMYIDGAVLRVTKIRALGDVVLGDYSGDRRLIVLAPREVTEEPLVSWCMERALGTYGLLWSVRADLPATVKDLVVPCEVAAGWLREGATEVTIAALGPGVPLVAACVLVCLGCSPPKAIEAVLPGGFEDIDDEIAVSVFRDAVIERRARWAKADGESA